MTEPNKKDMVNHPSHYTFGKIEIIDAIEDWKLDYHESNVVKYVARAKHKGKQIEDLKKAQWYLNRRIEMLERAEKPIGFTSESPKEGEPISGTTNFTQGVVKTYQDIIGKVDYENGTITLELCPLENDTTYTVTVSPSIQKVFKCANKNGEVPFTTSTHKYPKKKK